ncbi:rhamnan synthesis F family protein [Microbacterium azadirachtae]|uniref:Rhamnan synthesis protein F n=1 Tax=Microbacterium azadirachtae TaxID=582680 RepID=A0A0F0M0V3_9MICO|nr:rhamnan synthesis F family protein [Microbacterium azadirachtae]KJL37256.1 Rhamnan synthesis protein F [Microbacterium azadirachtae]
MTELQKPASFPVGGRRLVVYVVWDRRGGVEDFVPFALAGLREHAARVLVVVNGSLSEEGRAKLEPVSDEILVRSNAGFDIWAHKDALDHVGDAIGEFDEVLLTNDTWFGPVRPYGPVFDRMGERAVHFWGMTDHVRQEPNPFTGKGVLPYHLQSFWIAVRREMFLSEAWRRYWAELPEMPTYFDAVLKHEAVFTETFAQDGFTHDVAFPAVEIGTKNPSLYRAEALLDAGCPTLKRRPFLQWPPYLDRHAVVGRWTLEKAAAFGYPMELLWRNAARTIPPKDLNTDAAALEVLPDVDVSYDQERPLRTVVFAHIFYVEMTDEMLDRADTLPGAYDLVVTTSDPERAEGIREALRRRGHDRGEVDVRVVGSNDGRDQSAFLIACRDVLLSGDYDLFVKIHSKKTPQDGFNIGRHFKEQQFLNLLNSPGHTANLVALFQREPGLGMVFPPMIHIGYPTLGRGWSVNKPGAERLCEELGIRVPLDDVSPLAPFGSMYIGRPEALRILIEHPWTYDDFGGAEAYRDGGLAHILERLPVYAAGELGYHVRTVATAEYMSVSHTTLDFLLDEMSATTPGYTYEQIELIRKAGYVGTGSARDFARMYMRVNFPGTGARLRAIMASDSVMGKVARAARKPRTTLRRLLGR